MYRTYQDIRFLRQFVNKTEKVYSENCGRPWPHEWEGPTLAWEGLGFQSILSLFNIGNSVGKKLPQEIIKRIPSCVNLRNHLIKIIA